MDLFHTVRALDPLYIEFLFFRLIISVFSGKKCKASDINYLDVKFD